MIDHRAYCSRIKELPAPAPDKAGWPWTTAPDLPVTRVEREDLPSIGLVMPTYNSGVYVEEAIRSALAQGYPKLDLVVVDGGSNDNTLQVVKKYERWLGGWVSEPDKGQADAINKGWRSVKGEWLGWMNSDDTFLPGALWTLAREIGLQPKCEIVAGSAVWTDASGKVVRQQILDGFDYIEFLLTLKNHFPSGSTLIRRAVVERVGALDIAMSTICDTEYWIRAGVGAKVHTFPQPISTFRYHLECKTIKLAQMKGPELIRAYDRLFARDNLPPQVQKIRQRAYSFCYLEAARYACRTGDSKMSWHYLKKGLEAGWQFAGWGYLSVAAQNVLGVRSSKAIRARLHPARA